MQSNKLKPLEQKAKKSGRPTPQIFQSLTTPYNDTHVLPQQQSAITSMSKDIPMKHNNSTLDVMDASSAAASHTNLLNKTVFGNTQIMTPSKELI